MSKQDLSFTIVGGCFPIQDNIPSDKLYHAYINEIAKSKYNRHLNFEIIRYERFSDCLDKIERQNENKPADVLLFHFRSEHFLRLCKFTLRYQNEHSVIKRSLNLLCFNMCPAEQYDYLSHGGHSRKPKRSKFYQSLVAANYLLGYIAGNVHYTLKRYEKLADDVIAFCKEHDIKLMLAGPASRPHTWWENYLTNTIDRRMKRALKTSGTTYIQILGTKGRDGEPLFFNNGVQVNEAGHRRIAELILNRMDFLKES
jgi:hypothetical protein